MNKLHAVVVGLALLVSTSAAAQPAELQPVGRVADYASWATAGTAPTLALIRALRSGDDRACRLWQLGLSELIGNGSAFTIKHFVRSPRPCLGCAADGMPSGHSMNSVIGVASGWRVDIGFGIGLGASASTAGLRVAAHRHTVPQVVAGLLLGAGAEWAGHALVPCRADL